MDSGWRKVEADEVCQKLHVPELDGIIARLRKAPETSNKTEGCTGEKHQYKLRGLYYKRFIRSRRHTQQKGGFVLYKLQY